MQRQSELPQDQPGRFVKGIAGAVPEGHARIRELLGPGLYALKNA